MSDETEVEEDEGERPRRRRSARTIAIVLGVVLVGLVVVLATRQPAGSRLAESPLVGQPAPAVAGETIDGETYRLERDRGQWVVVNFFATWCVPCREEHDDLVRFATRHSVAGDAKVVGVIFSDDAEAVRRFRDEQGGNWPMVTDPEGSIALEFGIAGVPESFLISPDGIVVAKIVGGVREGDLTELLADAASS